MGTHDSEKEFLAIPIGQLDMTDFVTWNFGTGNSLSTAVLFREMKSGIFSRYWECNTITILEHYQFLEKMSDLISLYNQTVLNNYSAPKFEIKNSAI